MPASAWRWLLACAAAMMVAAVIGCAASRDYTPAYVSRDSRWPAAAAPGHPRDWPIVSAVGPSASQPADRPASQPGGPAPADDLERAVGLVSRLDYAQARDLLANLEGRLLLARDLERAPTAAFWAAFCDEKLGFVDQAATGYERLLDRYPNAPQARTAAERLSRLRRPVIHARPAVGPH